MISLRSPILALALLPGCVIDDVDLSGRSCPCVTGWVCDESIDRCVPSDAGPMADAATADAAPRVDAGPPPTTCETIAGVVFCEDFESGELAQWSAISPSEGGMIAPSTGAARAGAQGLRITASGGTSAARMSATIDSGTATDLHFRAWVFVASASVGPIDLFVLDVPDLGTIAAQMLPATGSFVVHVAAAGQPVLSDPGREGRWRVGEWTCVAGRVVRGEGNGIVEILDSLPHAARLSSVDTEWGEPYRSFSIALEAGTTGEVQLDDVMWTLDPVPCP